MAKRRKKASRKRPQQKIPMLTALGLVAGLAEPVNRLIQGDIQAALAVATRQYTGYDVGTGSFSATELKKGLAPLAIGLIGSTVASKLGANRRLRLPWVKL